MSPLLPVLSVCPPVSPLIIGSTKRMLSSESRQVDVIFDDHDVTDLKVWTESSRGIRHQNRLDTHQLEDPDRERDLGQTDRSSAF